jgi:hypothetical protein
MLFIFLSRNTLPVRANRVARIAPIREMRGGDWRTVDAAERPSA